jgi:thiamine-phosphate diphosphorylase
MASVNLRTLHVITEPYPDAEGHLLIARDALEAGARLIQFRSKNESPAERLSLARKLRAMTRECKAILMVNDFPELAKKVDANGVHVGKNDVPVEVARKIFGKEKIVGSSANTVEEALDAVKNGADYVGFGPVFQTFSKPDAASPRGIDAVRKVRRAFDSARISVPVIAVGGINEKNALQVMEAGADGLAVVSAVSRSKNRKKTVKTLLSFI